MKICFQCFTSVQTNLLLTFCSSEHFPVCYTRKVITFHGSLSWKVVTFRQCFGPGSGLPLNRCVFHLDTDPHCRKIRTRKNESGLKHCFLWYGSYGTPNVNRNSPKSPWSRVKNRLLYLKEWNRARVYQFMKKKNRVRKSHAAVHLICQKIVQNRPTCTYVKKFQRNF